MLHSTLCAAGITQLVMVFLFLPNPNVITEDHHWTQSQAS